MLEIANSSINIALKVFERNYPEVAKRVKLIQFSRLDEGKYYVIKANETNDNVIIELAIEDSDGNCLCVDEITDMLIMVFSHLISNEDDTNSDEFNEAYKELSDLILEYFDELSGKDIDTYLEENEDYGEVQ